MPTLKGLPCQSYPLSLSVYPGRSSSATWRRLLPRPSQAKPLHGPASARPGKYRGNAVLVGVETDKSLRYTKFQIEFDDDDQVVPLYMRHLGPSGKTEPVVSVCREPGGTWHCG